MTEKKQLPKVNPSLLKEDANSNDIIKLDLDNNIIIYNQQFKDALSKAKDVSNRAEKLLQIDVNDMTEDDMTQLRKDFKPVVKYQKQFDEFEKAAKRSLKDRDQIIIDTYHQTLSDNGFDKIPELTKKYRAYTHDFKANRANKRWAQIEERFNASLETYPEFSKYAADTLGSFNYYRIHHPKLISDAKTKPVNKATIEKFNQDMYQYHEDMQRLLQSTLSPAYYPRLIEQYADDPSTNNMLNLINIALQQQVKDAQAKLLQQVSPATTQILQNIWYNNQKINAILDQARPKDYDPDDFNFAKLKLMRQEADAISASIKPELFITNQQVDTDKLEMAIKPLLTQSTKRIYQTLTTLKTPQNNKKPDAKTAVKPEPKPREPYAWLMDYLQDRHQEAIHGNDKMKVDVLGDLFGNLTVKNSVWRQNVHNYHDIIKLVQYITTL